MVPAENTTNEEGLVTNSSVKNLIHRKSATETAVGGIVAVGKSVAKNGPDEKVAATKAMDMIAAAEAMSAEMAALNNVTNDKSMDRKAVI